MRSYDLTPLLRATVGFDRMFNMLDAAARLDEGALGYPPYNIEKTGPDAYRIVMAVAGFGEGDLDVTVKENSLVVTGKKDKAPETQAQARERYLHRGIATRAFERRFDLADHMRVTGARLENGLLHIELVRELPEAMKPRSIAIETVAPKTAKVIEDQAA
ncbi:MAG: Hsp20 family protein [Proteobacteria bacterium]|nr:Hsp20 family protein [Pseudomonadota bacterium]